MVAPSVSVASVQPSVVSERRLGAGAGSVGASVDAWEGRGVGEGAVGDWAG